MMYGLHYGGHWKLKDVPAGRLFLLPGETLALMTEYGAKAYLVGSGETCCVAPETIVIVFEVSEEEAADFLWTDKGTAS